MKADSRSQQRPDMPHRPEASDALNHWFLATSR